MSFIDIEKAEVRYRIILGRHDKITSENQIPEDCTAILLEFPYSNWKQADAKLRGITTSDPVMYKKYAGYEEDLQYRSLLALAKERNIPVGTAESPAKYRGNTTDSFLRQLDNIYDFGYILRIFSNPIRIIEYYAVSKLAASDQLIIQSSLNYRLVCNFAGWLENQPSETGITLKPRNLLMAQRAETFANYQLHRGIKNPNIALVVGAAHVRIKEALRMRSNERLRQIAMTPHLDRYVNTKKMGQIYFISNEYLNEDTITFAGGKTLFVPADLDDELQNIEDKELTQLETSLQANKDKF